ncbi:hypothetical protein B0T16DRAFT_455774 [Cercophora newfieldiana]|uniref:Uncharacterized protein n=1 Tax=Cercophora newfieldiana TaxID=92897 RepID=A0AA40CR29_9PEZI|nr:hypothetical protein B0T16DRAFT_455774 [Cercophora newfieldiana]
MIDPATDSLVLIDLGVSRSRGTSRGTCVPPTAWGFPQLEFGLFGPRAAEQPSDEERAKNIDFERDPDVNAAIVAVHDLVTRSATDRRWADDTDLFNGGGIGDVTAGPWTAHPDACLDSPAEAYHAALTDWLERRRADPRYRDGPSEPLKLPEHMPIPPGEKVTMQDYKDPLEPYSSVQPEAQVLVSGYKFFRCDAVRAGRSVVDWIRPLTVALDPTRTLLANGKYAEEEEKRQHTDGGRKLRRQSRTRQRKGLWQAK